MSSIHTPQQKKRLAYERDHYNRNGESNKAWRRAKPLKKAKARRAFRKASKDLLRVCAGEPERAPATALRKEGSIRQKRVTDWGAIHLKEFVASRRVCNSLNAGAKKARKRAREAALKASV